MKKFKLPVSDALLTKYNFFELYPFDGGGHFIQKEIVGSLDDREITRRILDGALADFGSLDALDFTKFERWSTIEKSCWINRMYFIASMARCAMLEKDAALAAELPPSSSISTAPTVLHPAEGSSGARTGNALRRDRDYNSGNAMGKSPISGMIFPASRIVNVINAMHFCGTLRCRRKNLSSLSEIMPG